MDVADEELVRGLPFGDHVAQWLTEGDGVAWGEGRDPARMPVDGGVPTEEGRGKAARPPRDDGAQGRVVKACCAAYIRAGELAEEPLGFGVPASARFGHEGDQVGLGKPAGILPVQFLSVAQRCRMPWGVGALGDKAFVMPLGCDHADVVRCGAAFCARVLYDIKAGAGAEGRVPLFQFHKAASGTKETTPLFRQGVVAEAGADPCEAWAAVDVRSKASALVADPAAAEAARAAGIGGKADT